MLIFAGRYNDADFEQAVQIASSKHGAPVAATAGADGRQIYAFGTETGDFLRLTDITESWKARYGDLLRRGSTSNPDHPKNPRVTIPGICDARRGPCCSTHPFHTGRVDCSPPSITPG